MSMTATIETTNRRRRKDEVRNFQASPGLAANLQRVLVDLVELHIQGK
jgi:starvation-inducible DNA-binding protein